MPPVPIQPNIRPNAMQRKVNQRMEAGQHVEAQIQDLLKGTQFRHKMMLRRDYSNNLIESALIKSNIFFFIENTDKKTEASLRLLFEYQIRYIFYMRLIKNNQCYPELG